MKLLYLITLLAISTSVYGQPYWECNFENTQHVNRFIIDTASYHHNSWQIGVSDKTIFSSAKSLPNAIITDTTQPYPINDTSVFIIKHEVCKFCPSPTVWTSWLTLSFEYKLDIDSGEIAKVEVSGNDGATWIDIMNEDTIYHFEWQQLSKPRLDTLVYDWARFNINLYKWRDSITSDTLLYRFTFISDSVNTNRDGWIIDNFEFRDYYEHIDELANKHGFTIYPNPSNGCFSLKDNSAYHNDISVNVRTVYGQILIKDLKPTATGAFNLNIPAGLYFLECNRNGIKSTQQLAIR